MLSLNGSLTNDQLKANQKIQCFIVNSEGIIKTLQIPFHLILRYLINSINLKYRKIIYDQYFLY